MDNNNTFNLGIEKNIIQNWDKNGKIYYTDEYGNSVKLDTDINPIEKLKRNLEAKAHNIFSFIENENPESEDYKRKANIILGLTTAPFGAGEQATAWGANKLAPYIGSKIATETAQGIGGGLVGGGVEGVGRGLIEGENPLKTGVNDAVVGALFGGLGGYSMGKLGKHFDGLNLYGNPQKQEQYFNDYINGLNDYSKPMAEFRAKRMGYGYNPNNTETSYLFAGENAFDVPKGKLNEARQMRLYGENNEDIRKATGWFKGVDGKYRYEIPDGKVKDTAIYDVIEDELGLNDSKYRYRLGDMYEAPELYKNYPNIANAQVVFEPLPTDYSGYTIPEYNEIHLNSDMANVLNKKYAQRIREIESTPEFKYYKNNVEKDGIYNKEIEQQFENTPLGEEWVNLQFDGVDELPQYIKKANNSGVERTLAHELQHLIQDNEGFAVGGSSNNSNYRNLAGEVEARLAGRRVFLDDERRKELSPIIDKFFGYDVLPENQIVEFKNDGLSASSQDNVLNLTGVFDKKVTPQEVKNYILSLVDEGAMETKSPDYKIDVPNKDNNIRHIQYQNGWEKLNRYQKKQHNALAVKLKELINNAIYTGSKVNSKQNLKPDVEKYHYFTVNVKTDDNTIIPIVLDTEQFLNESTVKPQTVHLYNFK